MEIQVQQTPNPNARKFILPGTNFDKPLSFADATIAHTHPLASALFALGGIYNVFMVQNFVTVNKYPDVAWDELEGAVSRTIVQFLGSHDAPA